ncbi:MAG TPA: hypothetical protein VHN39_05370, partial [Phenylobacterium sp.]|nr:hypothetical protein [Phenylobacterium sp.]
MAVAVVGLLLVPILCRAARLQAGTKSASAALVIVIYVPGHGRFGNEAERILAVCWSAARWRSRSAPWPGWGSDSGREGPRRLLPRRPQLDHFP